jgi:hypothetical protein
MKVMWDSSDLAVHPEGKTRHEPAERDFLVLEEITAVTAITPFHPIRVARS